MKFGAFIPDEGSEKFVHHMLLYQCPFINQNSGTYLQTISILCDHSPVQVRRCRGAGVMAGWAKGGQVISLFVCFFSFQYILCSNDRTFLLIII